MHQNVFEKNFRQLEILFDHIFTQGVMLFEVLVKVYANLFFNMLFNAKDRFGYDRAICIKMIKKETLEKGKFLRVSFFMAQNRRIFA